LAKQIRALNIFEGLEEMFDDINMNARMVKTVKFRLIFVARINNLQPLPQLIKEIAISVYEIKILNNKQAKLQLESYISQVYVNNERTQKEYRILHL